MLTEVIRNNSSNVFERQEKVEDFLLLIADGKLICFGDLPKKFSGKDTDNYANWVYSLTLSDPSHKERASFVHIKIPEKKIIYPSKPNTGDDECSFKVSRKRAMFVPVMCVHSHRTNWAFSDYRGDLGTILEGWGLIGEKEYVLPLVMVVSTAGDNYMLLRTKETPIVKRYEVQVEAVVRYDEDLLFELCRIDLSKLDDESIRLYRETKQVEDEFFGGSFKEYYKSLMNTFDVSCAFKLGFYFSHKDGYYQRFSEKEELIEYISSTFKHALSIVSKRG